MAIPVSDNVLKNLKKAVDTAGILNEANRFVMELFDLQYRNVFEILLYPADLTSSVSLTGLGTAALDTIVTRLHLQSINVPFTKIEYDNADLIYFAKGIQKPTECTLTFLENEIGVVRNYMEIWLNEIIKQDPVFGFRFRDNQLKAKKNAKIIPLMGSSLPSTGLIALEGLKLMGQSDIIFAHNEADPMLIEVNCSVDKVYWQTAANLFL